MISRAELVETLDTLLDPQRQADYGPNGLQVEGVPEVSLVVTGVTACEALIREAVDRGAQALVVHHGIFWDGAVVRLRGSLLKRVRRLLDGGITLLAYHLPLDRHPEVGNNAPALRDLGGTDLVPFAEHRGAPVGWKARLDPPLSPQEFLARLTANYACEPTAFLEGPDPIRTVGMVSGAAQGDLRQAVEERLDAFVTGELSEYNLHLAREEGIHHVSLGHHASERIGPRNLARWIAANLDVSAEFVDLPNPA
jgi:dinuclear metal center YbgI/SA1388 family protein